MICSLKFRKDAFILKMLLWIQSFGFETIPHPSCYLNSITYKTQRGPVVTLFSVQLLQLFQLRRRCPSNQRFFCFFFFDLQVCFGYSASYNTQGEFVILSLVCIDLLHCLRSVGTIIITTGSGLYSLNAFFTFSQKPPFFAVLM